MGLAAFFTKPLFLACQLLIRPKLRVAEMEVCVMRLTTIMLLAGTGLMLRAEPLSPDRARDDTAKLQGTWAIVSVEIEGKALPMDNLKDSRLTIQGSKYSFKLNQTELEFTYKLNVSKFPRAIDLIVAAGAEKGKVYQGIYKFGKDRYTICRGTTPERSRPTEFVTRSRSGYMMVVWKRAQPPQTTSQELAVPAAQGDLLGEGGPVLRAATQKLTWKELPDLKDRIIPRPVGMRVGMEILVDGKPLPAISYGGKTYLPVSRVGAEYTIRVWNHGPRRVAAIVSVDGLSVINGKAASESQPGYLVAPYSNVVIKGWRRNLDSVAAFAFVDRNKSYASLVGKPENIGVIGLVAIEEYVFEPHPALEKREKAGAGKRSLGYAGSIGTEYGRALDSHVYYVPFVRSSNKRNITIYYDTVEELRKIGVPVDRPYPVPFPGDSEFVPPPPGYKGR
jgi:uncharacterized protein (TIGR03067 family)